MVVRPLLLSVIYVTERGHVSWLLGWKTKRPLCMLKGPALNSHSVAGGENALVTDSAELKCMVITFTLASCSFTIENSNLAVHSLSLSLSLALSPSHFILNALMDSHSFTTINSYSLLSLTYHSHTSWVYL